MIRQSQAIASYNQYMNAVDRSYQVIATNNVKRKSMHEVVEGTVLSPN